MIVKEYSRGDKIEYPDFTLNRDMHVEPAELSLPDIHGDCILFKDPWGFRESGYDVHHVESLPVHQFYVRGLINHKDPMTNVEKTYIFTAKIEGLNVGKVDYNKLVSAAIDLLKYREEQEVANASE